MLGRVDGRPQPTLLDDHPESRVLRADGLNQDRYTGSYVPGGYDYGDPMWARPDRGPARHSGEVPVTDVAQSLYRLDDLGEDLEFGGDGDGIELSALDWREGFRRVHPTSWAARLGRIGSMLTLTSLIGLAVVFLSGSEAGLSFELAATADETEQADVDADVDLDVGAQADTNSWFYEIAFLNGANGSNALADEGLEEQAETTTTTAWVEPTIEPESEWVDAGNGVAVPDLLLKIRFCESTNNYVASHTNSSARGAYQFLSGSWDWYGHAERYGVPSADQATPAQQDEAALATLRQDGARPWAESRACWDSPNIDSRYATAKPAASATTSTTVQEATTTETTEPDTETTVAEQTTTTTATTTSEADDSSTTTETQSSETTQPTESTTVPEESTTTAADEGSG